MEGILHVPPDRGTIIGRAIWKPRYVVVSTPADTKHRNQQQQRHQSNASSTPSIPSASSTNPTRATTPASPSSLSADNMYLSIFKNKGDKEPIQQHAIGSITDCQVQMLAHRKQGPILPTLVINLSPDPVTDKLRKRRSSRTAGFTSTKETAPTTLWFRPAEENHNKHVLLEWCRFIQGLMLQLGTVITSTSTPGPLSPVTPASPTFVNPFSSHKERAVAPSAAPPAPAGRDDRPKYTDSPSLRSRRSDLSHTSSNLPPHVATSGYSNASSNAHYNAPFFQPQQQRPTDLPSPATTVNEFSLPPPAEFGEGFAAAQGRASAISSPSRGRDSGGSSAIPASATTGALTTTGVMKSSSPPIARETILDRAFQMRFIPGSQRDAVPGSENLSSLARFEALMREAEERKRQRQAGTASDVADARDSRADIKRSVTTAPYVGRPNRANSYNQQPQFKPQFASHSKTMEVPRSGWDLDEDSDDVDGSTEEEEDVNEENEEEEEDDDDEEDDEDEIVHSDDEIPDPRLGRNGRRANSSALSPTSITAGSGIDIAPNALRALDFIAGRHRDDRASQKKQAAATDDFDPSNITPKARGILSYDAQTLKALDSGPDPDEELRPQTGYSARNRPSFAQRTHSQPQLAALSVNNYINSMSKAAGQRRSHKPSSTHHGHTYSSPISPASPSPPPMPNMLPRAATTSRVDTVDSPTESPTTTAKRLSFTEFTKRLGTSTSSLLLVQANASGASSASTSSGSVHGGAGLDSPYMATHATGSPSTSPVRHASASRITSPPPPVPTVVERCGWRNSVNVITTEGGFL